MNWVAIGKATLITLLVIGMVLAAGAIGFGLAALIGAHPVITLVVAGVLFVAVVWYIAYLIITW